MFTSADSCSAALLQVVKWWCSRTVKQKLASLSKLTQPWIDTVGRWSSFRVSVSCGSVMFSAVDAQLIGHLKRTYGSAYMMSPWRSNLSKFGVVWYTQLPDKFTQMYPWNNSAVACRILLKFGFWFFTGFPGPCSSWKPPTLKSIII